MAEEEGEFVPCPAAGMCEATTGELLSAEATIESTVPWVIGDVFAGIWERQYNIFSNAGTHKDYIPPIGGQGYTAGCAFNADRSKLYSAFFQRHGIRVYDAAPPHDLLQVINADNGGYAESIDFDAAGNFYVGQPSPVNPTGPKTILKYNSAGIRQKAYVVETEDDARHTGVDWIDLASDDCTIFYTSEGRIIFRYDVCANFGAGQQLDRFVDVGDLPGTGPAYALRLLPPFDGVTGGLLLADRWDIKRLDGSGNVVWSTDYGSENGWFALNLDPDGIHFWAGGIGTGYIHKFKISDGSHVAGPFDSWTGTSRVGLYGLCLLGEPGGNEPPVADANGPYLGAVGTAIAFDGTGSSDPDSDPLDYDWDWGDGNASASAGGTPTHSYSDAGIYDVCLTVDDGNGATDDACTFAVVYDPDGGFVTGGGWIDSPLEAYRPDPSLTGKATFGFTSKYKKGAQAPTGNTEFQFQTADLNFHSSSYQWLVINQGGSRAQYKGSGTINGAGDYNFMLWAYDDPDEFRIKIWTENGGEVVVYDNGWSTDQPQALGAGSIVIHKK
jgi:hypothetical protein